MRRMRDIFAAVALAASVTFAPQIARAEAAPRVEPQELSRSIDDVLEGREFAWRSPRVEKKIPEAEETWVQRWRVKGGLVTVTMGRSASGTLSKSRRFGSHTARSANAPSRKCRGRSSLLKSTQNAASLYSRGVI